MSRHRIPCGVDHPATPHPAATPSRRRIGRGPRRDGTRLLTAAVAGGSVVAGHGLIGLTGTHVETVALQAFTAPAPDPGALGARTSPTFPMSTDDQRVDDVLASPRPADVSAIVDAATTAVRDATRERESRARPVDPPPTRAATTGPAQCAAGTKGFGNVADGVAAAGEQLRCMFSVDTVFGVAGRSNASDHPAGKALDLMVQQPTGDRLAEYAVANMERLGISYVIYRQRINTGDGWESMEDRGGITANHMDHVHISFD